MHSSNQTTHPSAEDTNMEGVEYEELPHAITRAPLPLSRPTPNTIWRAITGTEHPLGKSIAILERHDAPPDGTSGDPVDLKMDDQTDETHKGKKSCRPAKKYQCYVPGCIQRFETEAATDLHVERSHELNEDELPVACFFLGCPKRYKSFKARDEHVYKAHELDEDELRVACFYPGCPKTYKNVKIRDKHAYSVHVVLAEEDVRERSSCPYCHKKYLHKQMLRTHVRSIHEFWCKECNMEFRTQEFLHAHNISEHPTETKPPEILYECHLCKEEFPTDIELDWHLDMDH